MLNLHPEQIKAEIARRLASTSRPGSPNSISADEVRDWAIEYLANYEDELARFPVLVGKAHWNLWMMDTRPEDALFAVLVFRADGVEFFCGTGVAFAVRRYSESDFTEDVDLLHREMATLFAVTEPALRLTRMEAESWLGRGW